jgi:linoleate 9S-lipoxygenase
VLEVREMLQNIINAVTGDGDGNKKMKRETAAAAGKCRKIEGSVVLMKKNVLDFNDFNASVLDRVHELLGQKVSLQLVSAVNADPSGDYYFFFLSSPVNLLGYIYIYI